MIAQVEHRTAALDGGISHCDLRGDSVNPSATHTVRVTGCRGRTGYCGSMRLGLNNYSRSHTAGALRIDDRQRCLKVHSHGDAPHARPFSPFHTIRFVKCGVERVIKKKGIT